MHISSERMGFLLLYALFFFGRESYGLKMCLSFTYLLCSSILLWWINVCQKSAIPRGGQYPLSPSLFFSTAFLYTCPSPIHYIIKHHIKPFTTRAQGSESWDSTFPSMPYGWTGLKGGSQHSTTTCIALQIHQQLDFGREDSWLTTQPFDEITRKLYVLQY